MIPRSAPTLSVKDKIIQFLTPETGRGEARFIARYIDDLMQQIKQGAPDGKTLLRSMGEAGLRVISEVMQCKIAADPASAEAIQTSCTTFYETIQETILAELAPALRECKEEAPDARQAEALRKTKLLAAINDDYEKMRADLDADIQNLPNTVCLSDTDKIESMDRHWRLLELMRSVLKLKIVAVESEWIFSKDNAYTDQEWDNRGRLRKEICFGFSTVDYSMRCMAALRYRTPVPLSYAQYNKVREQVKHFLLAAKHANLEVFFHEERLDARAFAAAKAETLAEAKSGPEFTLLTEMRDFLVYCPLYAAFRNDPVAAFAVKLESCLFRDYMRYSGFSPCFLDKLNSDFLQRLLAFRHKYQQHLEVKTLESKPAVDQTKVDALHHLMLGRNGTLTFQILLPKCNFVTLRAVSDAVSKPDVIVKNPEAFAKMQKALERRLREFTQVMGLPQVTHVSSSLFEEKQAKNNRVVSRIEVPAPSFK